VVLSPALLKKLTNNGSAIVGESFAQLYKGDGIGWPGDLPRYSSEGQKILLGYLIISPVDVDVSHLLADINRTTTEFFLSGSENVLSVFDLSLSDDGSFVAADSSHDEWPSKVRRENKKETG
jgi:hypothetical protein